MAIEAYAYTLYQALGIFLPLIAVNCIIFARAEMFASKNTVFNSILDALGSGVGFTLALFLIASIREIFGRGSFFGYAIPWLSDNSAMIFSLAPGGFIVLAIVLAAVNKLTKTYELRAHHSCDKCPNAAACGKRENTANAEN
jgi:electron transport complex protein RnfE